MSIIPEQRNCPVCTAEYTGEYTVDQTPQTFFTIRECSNQHSWQKYPGQVEERVNNQAQAFENVYRPLHDTQEPVKRLFSS